MMNYIWGFMMIIGIVFGAFNGTLANMADQMLDSGKEAVTLCITMMGIMSIWTGLMEVAKESGMIEGAAKKLDPFICFLFPKLPEKHEAREHITTNIIANILGLGWAATPAGGSPPSPRRPSSPGRRSFSKGAPCTALGATTRTTGPTARESPAIPAVASVADAAWNRPRAAIAASQSATAAASAWRSAPPASSRCSAPKWTSRT